MIDTNEKLKRRMIAQEMLRQHDMVREAFPNNWPAIIEVPMRSLRMIMEREPCNALSALAKALGDFGPVDELMKMVYVAAYVEIREADPEPEESFP